MTPSPAALPTVTTATLADIPTIIQLAEATWEPTYRFIISREQIEYMYRVIYTPTSLQHQMEQDGHTFLLLYTEGQPAGYASFSPLMPEEHVIKLHKIYLLPSHQGLGLGQYLIKAVETAARERGAQVLELNVNRHNPAIAFYEHQGFQRHQEVDIAIGPYWMNDYVMRKPLTTLAHA